MPSRLRISAALTVAAVALSACAAFDPAAAVVGSHKIEDDAFVRKLDFVLADPRFAEQAAPGVSAEEQRRDLIHGLLTFLIHQEVIDERAEQEGIEVPDEELEELLRQQIEAIGGEEAFREVLDRSKATLADARDLVRAQLVRERVAQAVVEAELTDEELMAAYEERIREFTTLRASHILVRSEDQARQIAARATPKNFGDLAEQFSRDPGSAQQGGDLGSHPATDFVEEFADAALEIPEGQIGGPVQSEFGFHVIWIREREQVPFEQVRDQLLGERASQVFSDWLREQLRSVTVRVNPRYGIFDPQTAQVVDREATSPEPVPGPQITP